MRIYILCIVGIALHLTAAASPAEDIPINGSRLVAKSAPQSGKPRFMFRSKSEAVVNLLDPAVAGAALTATEVSCSGVAPAEVCTQASTSSRIDLASENWRGLGNPAGSRGYLYRDRSGASGGVRHVLYRDGQIRLKAVGTDWPWQPVGSEDRTLFRFEVGDRTYCSEFGGIARVNQAGFLLLRNAPAPAQCRDVCGDGEVTGDETCDPPNGTSCSATCQVLCPEEASNVIVECVSATVPSIGMSANGATFAAAYRMLTGTDSHLFVKRLDDSGQTLDAAPLRVSSDLPPPPPEVISTSNGSPALTALDSGFYAAWSGTFSTDSVFIDYFHGRVVPASGPLVEDVDILHTEVPFGQCSTYSAPPLHVTANLAATGVHVTWRSVAQCSGSILFENIVGVPGDFASPPPGNTSRGSAPLATSDDDVAAVWWNMYSPTAGPPVELTLKAGWIDPEPTLSIVLTELASVARSDSPALAVIDDFFLAVWTTATAPPPAVPTEVRGMRFTRTDGPLDAPGGFLIASSANGAALQPVVAADGSVFAVAWRETTASGSAVRAIRVETDGTLADAAPIDVATSDAAAAIGIAASPAGTLVGFTRSEDFGYTSVRVAPLP